MTLKVCTTMRTQNKNILRGAITLFVIAPLCYGGEDMVVYPPQGGGIDYKRNHFLA